MESHHVFLLFFYLIFIQKKYTYLHVAFWTFTNLNLTVSRDKSDFDMRQLRANLLCQSLWNTKHDHVQNLQIGLELFLQTLPYVLATTAAMHNVAKYDISFSPKVDKFWFTATFLVTSKWKKCSFRYVH